MKKILKPLCTVLIMLAAGVNLFAQDFTVTSSRDKYNQLCTPVRNGSPAKVKVTVKSNREDTCTVSIDKSYSFPGYDSWVNIDNSGQSIVKNQIITFNLEITPANAMDGDLYTFKLTFIVRDKKGNTISPSYNEDVLFGVRVDNSAPSKPVVSITGIKNNSLQVNWKPCYDVWSNPYTASNISEGSNGIKSYTVVLKNSAGTIIKGMGPIDASSYYYSGYYPYSGLTPGTIYIATVTASDFADNLNTSSEVSVSTLPPPPPAPTNLTVSGTTFCSITLAWTASPTATSYNVYNAAAPNTIIASTPFTSFSATGLTIGTTYSFFVKAVNEVGISLPSSTLAATTQSAPPISGPYRVCASGATFKVYGLPSGCTITWNQSFNLVRVSASGYSAKFASNGNGSAWIDATVKTPSCGSIPLPRLTVLALGTSLRITAKRISAVGEPYVVLFTAPADGHTSYTWYVNGSSQGETGNTFDLYIPCGISKTVKCESSNFCGSWETSNSITIKGPCDRDLSYTVSPNPASSTVTVSAVSPRVATDSTGTTYPSFTFVKVYDFQGNLKKSLKYSDANSVAIDVAGLKGGSYLFEVGNAEHTEKHQVLISR